jgi:hypothetical protein
MLACLPRSGAVALYIDVDAMRSAGIMDLIAGSKSTEDLEYQKFVEGTGFDYRKHLRALAASFSGNSTFLLVRGAFDWRRLNAYATASGGTCNNSLCRVPASPNRFVSFYPMRSDTMALAFSNDEWAALDIASRPAPDALPAPDQPLWLSASGAAMRDVRSLPTGTRSFVSPLESADSIVLSVGPSNDKLSMKLEVMCATEASAADLAAKLQGATEMLRKMLERERVKANPGDLSGLLIAGTFRREAKRVMGSWPVDRALIESIAAGRVD